MNQADQQYNKVVTKIIEDGFWDNNEDVRTKWADGKTAYSKSWIAQTMVFDNTQVPIISTKHVAWKTAIKELLWIWQMKSNRVQDLRDMGVNIWNEWELEDGTIGKAYGYQLGKKNRKITQPYLEVNGTVNRFTYMVDQVDYLIAKLRTQPASRRHITTLWNPDDLDDMALTPCVYETQWHVKGGRLHLEVRCRSNDMALGNPFNVFQYNVLQRMMAQITGLKLGSYIFHIGDAHIYERHIDNILEQIERPSFDAPKLWINPDIKQFSDFTIDDFILHDYAHGEKLSYEIAI